MNAIKTDSVAFAIQYQAALCTVLQNEPSAGVAINGRINMPGNHWKEVHASIVSLHDNNVKLT